jgi:hypothetical protein
VRAQEFYRLLYERTRDTGTRWAIHHDTGKLRAEGGLCPITFLAGQGGYGEWLPTEADIAGRLMGLHNSVRDRIIAASNGRHAPRVSGKLVTAIIFGMIDAEPSET